MFAPWVKSSKTTPALFIVDAITGVGTMPLDIDAWGLDFVISGSQKAFMLPPGLALLAVSPKAWERMESAKLPRYYFDLRRERKAAAKGESAWTPAISLILGLAEVLKYIKTLGMDQLVANAQQLGGGHARGLPALGLELFAPASPSGAVTAVKAPPGLSSTAIVKEFRERFGSIIADGQAKWQGQIFRVAHLGYFDIVDLFGLVAELELILEANGVPVKLGTGVAAVRAVLRRTYRGSKAAGNSLGSHEDRNRRAVARSGNRHLEGAAGLGDRFLQSRPSTRAPGRRRGADRIARWRKSRRRKSRRRRSCG